MIAIGDLDSAAQKTSLEQLPIIAVRDAFSAKKGERPDVCSIEPFKGKRK